MGSRYELEVTVTKAKDLKNVNWRNGRLKPYAVLWIDPNSKCSTKVDDVGDNDPEWNEKILIPFNSSIEDSTLYVDVVHAGGEEDTKPLIGSGRLFLREIVDEVGIGRGLEKKLELRRPSGRPQGKLVVTVMVREPSYRAPDPYYAPAYGVPPPRSRDYGYAAPASGYPYGGPAASVPPPVYGQPAYGNSSSQVVYVVEEEKKKSKFGGMGAGTGLAVGAVAGVLGGIALAEGAEYVEDEIADDVAEKVEEDLGYDDAGEDW